MLMAECRAGIRWPGRYKINGRGGISRRNRTQLNRSILLKKYTIDSLSLGGAVENRLFQVNCGAKQPKPPRLFSTFNRSVSPFPGGASFSASRQSNLSPEKAESADAALQL